MSSLTAAIYEHRPEHLRPGHAFSLPIPSNIDEQNPHRNLLTIIITPSQYNRSSRSGNARRAVSQPDHDILEGLPIRRWQKKSVVVNTAGVGKPDTHTVTILNDGYPELEMPKDSNLLPEVTYAILRAARMGVISKEGSIDHDRGAEHAADQSTQPGEKSGLFARKWTLVERDSEPKELEYLAKRRKGLRSLYGGSTAPINTSGRMRKIKIRNIDSEGNSQIVEALVPEGQTVNAEIVEEDLTSPTHALAPGTKVEGIGVANAEGVLVPQEQAAPVAHRRKPPPPKRRLKGPSRSKKKKVAFASGTDGSTAPGDLRTVVGNATKPSNENGEPHHGPHSIEGDNEGEDSVMHDAGQEGEEGSEDVSEGDEVEDADREEGEVSATPEATLAPSRSETVAKQEPTVEVFPVATAPVHPAVTAIENHVSVDAVPEQQPAVPKAESAPQRTDESHERPSNDSTNIGIIEPPEESEMEVTISSSVQAFDADATPASLPEAVTETMNEPSLTTSAPSGPSLAAQAGGRSDVSGSPAPPSQQSAQNTEEQTEPPHVRKPPLELADLPIKSPPLSVEPNPIPTTQELAPSKQAPTAEQTQEDAMQSAILAPSAQPVPIDLPGIEAHSPQLPTPLRPPPPEIAAASEIPLETSGDAALSSKSVESIPDAAPAGPTTALHQDRQEMSQNMPTDSWVAPTEHHTPKAPTPSPPTPIATSFDMHQRERLMESPRAPTMSPPTPARRDSGSPDLPLTSHGQPPPLELASASESCIPGLGQQLPAMDERIDVEAAPHAPENFAAEIPHEHNPLDGLAAPTIPDEVRKGGEEVARFSDGEEDLLGSLERSLGK